MKQHIKAHQEEEQDDTNVMKAASTRGPEQGRVSVLHKAIGKTKETGEDTQRGPEIVPIEKEISISDGFIIISNPSL